MKALVKRHARKGLWMENVPLPEVGNNDVLIKIHKTAICGTDIHIYNWDEWARKTIPVPMTIGHEFAGEITQMGSNVTDLSVGDIVSVALVEEPDEEALQMISYYKDCAVMEECIDD